MCLFALHVRLVRLMRRHLARGCREAWGREEVRALGCRSVRELRLDLAAWVVILMSVVFLEEHDLSGEVKLNLALTVVRSVAKMAQRQLQPHLAELWTALG